MSALPPTFLSLLVACANSGAPVDEGPFDRDVVEACAPGTSSVSVRTRGGGRMSIRLVGGCLGEPSCESTDLFAPGAWATVRVAGSELLLEGCSPLSAVSASALEVTFRSGDGPPETYSIPLSGACLDAGPSGCMRPSPDAGARDAGAGGPPDAASSG